MDVECDGWVGHYFFTLDEHGGFVKQGQVIEHLGDNKYRAQLFEWGFGEESTTCEVTEEELTSDRYQTYRNWSSWRKAGEAYITATSTRRLQPLW